MFKNIYYQKLYKRINNFCALFSLSEKVIVKESDAYNQY